MFYHPTKCPRCKHSNTFGKINCQRCRLQLYTEDMKPIHASERFFEASDRNRKIAKGEIYSSSAVKLNELSSVGLLFLELIIKLISETRRSIGDLRHVVEVIFKSPPDER